MIYNLLCEILKNKYIKNRRIIMIGIICAMDEELEVVLKLMKDTKKENRYNFNFFIGTINDVPCCAVKCGVGKVNSAICTQTIILVYKPNFILNIGVAGALKENINISDVVIAENVVQHDFDVSAFPGREKGEICGIDLVKIPCSKWLTQKIIQSAEKIKNISIHKGTILTGDQFINSSEKLIELRKTFNGTACEMEAGSVGHVCYYNGVDFAIIRSISDRADKKSPVDFESFIKTSSKNSAAILNEFTKSFQD